MKKISKLTSNTPLKIALVGCGRISTNHIKAIGLHKDRAELVALCDNQENRIRTAKENAISSEAFKAKYHNEIQEFSCLDDLLRRAKTDKDFLDLIVLATPSGLHHKQVISIAAAGIHVCTEKPMATSWEDGLDMVRVCEDANVNLFVVKQNRFNNTIQLLRDQLIKGRFGKLSMVTVNVFWHRPQAYYDQESWRGTWEMDGGALMNQASHYVDMLDWLVGPVASVSASISTIGRQIEAEDTVAIQFKLRNGGLGTMAVTMLTYPKNLEGSITILGESGTVKLGGPAVNQIEHWEFKDKSKDDLKIKEASYQTSSVYGFGHPPYYANLLDTLEGKAKPMCNGMQGLRSLELIIGAYRSAKEEKIVHFPLDN